MARTLDLVAVDRPDRLLELVERLEAADRADARRPALDGELDAVLGERLLPRVVLRRLGVDERAVEIEQERFDGHQPIVRPISDESAAISDANSGKSAAGICCGPSHSASSGRGCTSTMIPSAPTATAARASGSTSSRRPGACDGSTITGRCVSALSTGTALMSSV